MPAKYVRPYCKDEKNDYRDAEAIAEAVQRPARKFVAAKTAEQPNAASASITGTYDGVRRRRHFPREAGRCHHNPTHRRCVSAEISCRMRPHSDVPSLGTNGVRAV